MYKTEISEGEAIQASDLPRTRASLAADLEHLGLQAGQIVIVHTRLRSLGWVCGGAVALIQALQDVLTPDGTLVMPAHSGDLTDPINWSHPPVPADWVPIIRENMPAYDPAVTPTRAIGRVPEQFRTYPGVLRSGHPSLSFSAWGRYAREITAGHALEYSLGEQSPLARIYDLDGWVLFLGTGFDTNTSFHLSEYRQRSPRPVQEGTPVFEDGRRVWKYYADIEMDSDRFAEIGAAFEPQADILRGQVGSAEARLFRQRPAVDFAVVWLDQAR